MTEQEINEAIGEIAEHYGARAQTMQACEECANNIAEEIADVRSRIPEPEVSERIDEKLEPEIATLVERKLERQLERIKGEQK